MPVKKNRKICPALQTDSFLSQGLKMKRKGRQAHSSSFLLMVVGQRVAVAGGYEAPLIVLLLSIACMHPLPTRQQPRPFQTNGAVYVEFGPLSISLSCALHPDFTVSQVTFIFSSLSY